MIFKDDVFRFLLGMVLLTAVSFPPAVHGQERSHTVQAGETFFSISQVYGIGVDELMRHNGFTDPTRLQLGQRLRIPATTVERTYIDYQVVWGDTFYGLARRYFVTEREIRETNNLSSNYVLREGDRLRIPVPGATPTVAPVQTATVPAPPVISPVGVSQPRSLETRALSSDVRWPIIAREINYMTGRIRGVMIAGARSEPVISLTRGMVISVGPYRGFGRVAIVQTEGGYLYVYAGCESISVREGERVFPGTEIGRLGVDMVTALPQLFFMVFQSGVPVDPAVAPRT